MLFLSLSLSIYIYIYVYIYIHTHTHTHIFVCVYIYIMSALCVCVCVSVSVFRGGSDTSQPRRQSPTFTTRPRKRRAGSPPALTSDWERDLRENYFLIELNLIIKTESQRVTGLSELDNQNRVLEVPESHAQGWCTILIIVTEWVWRRVCRHTHRQQPPSRFCLVGLV